MKYSTTETKNNYVITRVDSEGRTLHVPNLIRGENKYHPYFLK